MAVDAFSCVKQYMFLRHDVICVICVCVSVPDHWLHPDAGRSMLNLFFARKCGEPHYHRMESRVFGKSSTFWGLEMAPLPCKRFISLQVIHYSLLKEAEPGPGWDLDSVLNF